MAASLEASAHSLRRDADALTEIALDPGSRRAFAHSRPAAPTRPEARYDLGSPGSTDRKREVIPPNIFTNCASLNFAMAPTRSMIS